MKRILLAVSVLTAALAIVLALSGLYVAFWQSMEVIPIALALIGAGAVSGILSVAALLAAMLSKMTGKI
jgi:hypothetical protein